MGGLRMGIGMAEPLESQGCRPCHTPAVTWPSWAEQPGLPGVQGMGSEDIVPAIVRRGSGQHCHQQGPGHLRSPVGHEP